MILLFFNIIGIGSSPKRTSFKRILDRIGPYIVFLQETMTTGDNACDLFLKLKPAWNCCGVDANGMLGGLLVAWNLVFADFSPIHTIVGIKIEGRIRGLEWPLNILNIYGPYSKKKFFGDRVADAGLLGDSSLIIVGDLNLTLSPDEDWGCNGVNDPLDPFF